MFRENLKKYPRDGRSLLGLRESLQAQDKSDAARLVQQEFEAAWKRADTALSLADLLPVPGAVREVARGASAREEVNR